MRRLVVLVALFAVMFGLRLFSVGGESGDSAFTLAAIGFVLLAAFTVAELGSLLKLPRVTGYIVSGVLLGPFVWNILSSEVVKEMQMFNKLALGLIATGAGLELDLRQIARIWRTLLSTIAVKITLVALMVLGTFLAFQSFSPLPGLSGSGAVWSVGLVLAALSIGTSPAIALAVMNETRAKGRLMDLVLGAAVLKDLVVVICLAVAVAVSRSLLGSSTGGGSVITLVAQEIGASVLAGAVLGALLVLYIRFIHAEMLLFVAAMILVVSEVGQVLHLELLLVFITAGFVVRNFSKYEHELLHPVETVALPVFVVFFTNAGAGIDLSVTLKVLPLAFALCLVRGIGYVFASRIGGRFGKESPVIRTRAWLGYLPQAGVTLGLVGLASQQLPQVSNAIMSTGMAVVALNLLVGPITLRQALKSAGELPKPDSDEDKPVELGPGSQPSSEFESLPPEEDLALRLDQVTEELQNDKLEPLLREVFSKLLAEIEEFAQRKFLPWVGSFEAQVRPALDGEEGSLSRWVVEPQGLDVDEYAEHCRELSENLRGVLRRVPAEIVVPLEDHNRKVLGSDSPGIRLKKRLRAVFRLVAVLWGGAAERHVPAQIAFRVGLEARLAELGSEVLALTCRGQATVFEEMRAFAMSEQDKVQALKQVDARLQRLVQTYFSKSQSTVMKGLEEVGALLRKADSPYISRKELRLSNVEPRVREGIERLEVDPPRWSAALAADQGSLRVRVELATIENRLSKSLEQGVIEPARTAIRNIEAVVLAARNALAEVNRELPEEGDLSEETKTELEQRCLAACNEAVLRELERGAARFRAAVSVHAVAAEARAAVEKLPEKLTVAKASTPTHQAMRPGEVRTVEVALRHQANRLVATSLLPSIDGRVRAITAVVAMTATRIREAIDVASYALTASGVEDEPGDSLRAAFERAFDRLDDHLVRLSESFEEANEGIETGARTALDELVSIGDQAETGAVQQGLLSAFLSRFGRFGGPMRQRLGVLTSRVRGLLERARGSQLSLDARARALGRALDAGEIRGYAKRHSPVGIPKSYQQLFQLAPVREHRLYAVYTQQLETLLEAERCWLAGEPGSALLVGRHGSGRTSTLNLCQLELGAPRILRPEPLEFRRGVGIVEALAIELGVRPRRQALLKALKQSRTTVILDDLEQWFNPDVRGLGELDSFLDLVVATRDYVFWLVSVEYETLHLFEESVAVRETFASVVALEPLKASELAQAIESRNALSGRQILYPHSVVNGLMARLRRTDETALYFEVLARLSDGNLSRAYAAWLRSVHVDDEGNICPEVHRALSITLPLVRELPPAVLGMLVQLLRFGPMDGDEFGRFMRLTPTDVRRHLHFLRASGLVEPFGPGRDSVRIPAEMRSLVVAGLKEYGVDL